MDDEKPLDLRDKLAVEILNGILSNAKTIDATFISTLMDEGVMGDHPRDKMERVIRGCYRAADIIRKVRLTVFE